MVEAQLDNEMLEARERLDDSVLPIGVIWSRCPPCYTDPSRPDCAMVKNSGNPCLTRANGFKHGGVHRRDK